MVRKKPEENRHPDMRYIAVRKSKIHGTGVFAAKNIKKGTRIIEYVGEIISKEEAERRAEQQLRKSRNHTNGGGVYIFELDKHWDIDGNVSWNPARYINHSCEPNCESIDEDGRIVIVALRADKQGEELNYDYGYDVDDWEAHPCRCGAASCVGFIIATKYRGKIRRRLGNFAQA